MIELPRAPWHVRLLTHARSLFGICFLVPFTFLYSFLIIFFAALRKQHLATKLIRVWANVLLGLFGIRVAVDHEEHLPDQAGGIIVFNHQSLFDIPCLIHSTHKSIRFGAKIELFKIPFFGAAMNAVGTLPIARENRSQVMKIYKKAELRFRENTLFVLAPEGTRQKEPVIGRFKKGPFIFAINAGVPIIPVVLKGAHDVLPKKTLAINVGRWWRTISVEYLPPIATTGLALDRVDEVCEKVRAMMVQAYERLPATESP